MALSGPFNFLFSGRRRSTDLRQPPEQAIDDSFITDPLHVARSLEAVSPDDILTEDLERLDITQPVMLHTPPVSPGKPGRPVASASVQPEPSTCLRSPVFIVGSPRSGTSILTDGMLAAGYKGFREGNFLTLLRVFEANVDRHQKTFGSGSDKVMATCVDWDTLKSDIFAAFKRQVDSLNPEEPWMDKTGNPEMIEAIPQILKLWPDAAFILAKRRGIENVISRLKKFPGHNFDYHCRDWAKNMTAWRAVRNKLGTHGIEIDQQEIIRSPEIVADKLSLFLGANGGARERIRVTFVKERPQQTEDGSAERIVSLDATGWSQEQRASFQRLCWDELEAFGYSDTESYWASDSID